MSAYISKFLNHASFYFENDEEIIVIDPWFFGKIFDNSWSLLKEVDESEIQINKIKHIFISHEHPDHLHWGTLKFIREKTAGSVTAYITERHNKNVRDNLTKIGFEVVEITPRRRTKLNNNFYYAQFPHGHDSALIFEVDGAVHLNQNDCYLDDHQAYSIKDMYPTIDYWWMQFSLAGYYANRDDFEGLQAAKDFHLKEFSKYHSMFKPVTAIPFASYVYFCKKYNAFLNNWAVSLEELAEKNPNANLHIPYCGDVIGECDNQRSIDQWQRLIEVSAKDCAEPEEVEDHTIVSLANDWLKKNQHALPYNKIVLSFFEDKRNFVFDFEEHRSYFTDEECEVAGTLTKEGLLCFVKFPWGADTLNITSCFNVEDPRAWKFLLQYKDSTYVR